MSSIFWFSWQDVCCCLTITVVSLWGALSDERSGLPFTSQSSQYLVICQYVHKYLHFICLTKSCVHMLYLRPLSVRAQYSNLSPTNSSSRCHDSLDTWTVLHMSAAKFKPLIFSVWGFALSNIANIFIFMIMNYFCFFFCIILLCNHKRTEFGKLHAYCEQMCALENCQWCGEPCFALAAISTDGFLPQIPRRDRQSHYRPNESFVSA
jgi:hypothetical protein